MPADDGRRRVLADDRAILSERRNELFEVAYQPVAILQAEIEGFTVAMRIRHSTHPDSLVPTYA